MKIILILSAFFSVTVMASDYVSPLKYKNLTCDDMKQEWERLVVAGVDALADSVDTMNGQSLNRKLEHRENEKNYSSIEAEQKAIEEMVKIQKCPYDLD